MRAASVFILDRERESSDCFGHSFLSTGFQLNFLVFLQFSFPYSLFFMGNPSPRPARRCWKSARKESVKAWAEFCCVCFFQAFATVRWSGIHCPAREALDVRSWLLALCAVEVARVHAGFLSITLKVLDIFSSSSKELIAKGKSKGSVFMLLSSMIIRASGMTLWVEYVLGEKKIHNSDKMLFENSNQLFQVEDCKIYSK